MRNFARINNYLNRIESRRDWEILAEKAASDGFGGLVDKYRPSSGAGWREIDRRIGLLRDAMVAKEEVDE